MEINSFIEDLTKKGYILHEDIDSYTLIFPLKDHLLTGVLLELNRSGTSFHFKFKKTNPKVLISGFVDNQKQLMEKYIAFINAIKLVSKTPTFNISPLS